MIRDDSLGLLGVAVGDTVTIQPPGSQPVRLRVAGTVYDPSLAPTPQETKGRGYLYTAALGSAGQPAKLDQLKIQVADPGRTVPSRDRDTVVAKAAEVGRWLQQAQGLAISEIQVPQPYAHPGGPGGQPTRRIAICLLAADQLKVRLPTRPRCPGHQQTPRRTRIRHLTMVADDVVVRSRVR